jgi:hypothetical protein
MAITFDVKMAWPQRGAKLFTSDGPPHDFSMIGWGDASHQYVIYMNGYKTAADELIQHALASKNAGRLDTLIFPILFLYRQYIELELKWVFLVYSDADRSVKKSVISDVGHNLIKLWQKVRAILLEDATPKEQQDVNIVEDYIEQFHKLDESSFSFRYPITKNLDQILNDERRINLPNLRQRMDELYHFFNGADGKLSITRDYRQDMEKYFSDAGDNNGCGYI